jgi:hypothetical protein
MQKYYQAGSTYILALHTPWCHFISGLWRISLAEYPSYSGFIPTCLGCDVSWLLQELDDSCHSGGVRAWSFLVILSMMLLLELTLVLASIWNKGDVSSKLSCFRYFWTWVLITLLNSDACWTTCKMDVTYDLLCWITTILAFMLVGLKSLVIFIRLPKLYGFKYDNLITSVIVFILVLL